MFDKRRAFLFLMLLLIVTTTACFRVFSGDESNGAGDERIGTDLPESINDIVPNNLWTVSENITIRLMQNRYPPDMESMTLILENRSDSVLTYGYGWLFEKYENGEWHSVKPKENIAFPAIEIILHDHDKQTLTFFRQGLSRDRLPKVYTV